MEEAIAHPLLVVNNSDRTVPDIVPMSSCKELVVYIIANEGKNEFGDGGSDPSTQAAFSFLRAFSQEEVTTAIPHNLLFSVDPLFA